MGTQRVGTASISSTATGSFNLGTPLHDVRVLTAKSRRTLDSLDLTNREVITYGAGRAEVEGLIRFHDNGGELVSLIEAGLDGDVLTYTHGSTHAGITCHLTDAGAVEPDADLAGKGYYQVRLTLRRNTVGDWSSIL